MKRSRILAVIGELESAGMTQHVRMNLRGVGDGFQTVSVFLADLATALTAAGIKPARVFTMLSKVINLHCSNCAIFMVQPS